MGFIERAAEGQFQMTADRIRQGKDYGTNYDPRPEIDLKQRAEFLEEARGNRTDEPYRQCLEYYGFRFYEVRELPMLEGGVYREEGEWRHLTMKLAFTPTDIASSFPAGPESLDRYMKDEILSRKVRAGKVPKSELRRQRKRRSFG